MMCAAVTGRPAVTIAAQHFAISDRHGLRHNPLYTIGMGRVSAWVADTRIALGGSRGTAAASLIVFGAPDDGDAP